MILLSSDLQGLRTLTARPLSQSMNDLDNQHGVPFPPSRLSCHNDGRFHYLLCRAPPEDVLSSVTGESHPSVGLMGAGDPRSIFYTLYRNFDPEFRGRFRGATFIVNENWSVLLARDILLLYLCLQLPNQIESLEAKQMYAAVWAISFCHTLYPPHLAVLKSALGVLVKFSSDPNAWESPENPLRRIVIFMTPEAFKVISGHWKQWSAEHPRNVPTLKDIADLRRKFLTCLHKMPMQNVISTYPDERLTHMMGLSADIIPESTQKSMKTDFAQFLKSGTVFVEDTLGLCMEKTWQPTPNVTFFDGTKNAMANNPFYGQVPFPGFFHTFLFSPKDCRSATIARSIVDKLPVKDDKFEEHPLVANCVQQLALWMSASLRVLRKLTAQTKPDITFTFECSDAISLCLHMTRDPHNYLSYCRGVPSSFDVIHTFQLIDTMSPPDLVLHAIRLLKPNALLFTTSVTYQDISFTLDQFLGSIFGVHPQIFAVMYGVRCLGVESTFSDSTLPHHSPWNHVKKYKTGDCRTLVFKRNVFSPFKITSLSDISFVPSALQSCNYATITGFPSNSYSNQLSTETMITNILTVAAQLDSGTPTDRYMFWEPYVKLIREELNFKPYFYHFQVTAMLHNLHFHITVTERDCPMCRSWPLSSYVAQFSVEISNPNLTPHSTIGVFITRGHVDFDKLVENLRDTHCIQSVALRKDKEERYFVDFFFPRSFAEADYSLSVLKFTQSDSEGGKVLHLPTVLYDGALGVHVTKGSRYYFRPLSPRESSLETSFGSMKSNVAECENIRTVVSLTQDLVYKVDWKNMPLSSDQVNQRHLKLKCAHHEYNIHFPYPILFPDMKIEFHCKLRTATITAPRDLHTFYEESPMFVVTPTNRLFMPAFPVNSSSPRDFLALQLNSMEDETLKRMPSSIIPPVIRLKHTVRDIFQLMPQCRFMNIHAASKKGDTPYLRGVVVVHDEVVDLDTKSPAIDVSYCFLKDDADQTNITSGWKKITADYTSHIVTVDPDQLTFVKKMFGYFAERTHTVYSDNNRTSLCRVKLLKKHQLLDFFKRAVLFPLYACADCHPEEEKPPPKKPEKNATSVITGVFSPGSGGLNVTTDLKKVIEALNPKCFSNLKAKEEVTANGSVNMITAEGGTDALVKLIQESTARMAGGGNALFRSICLDQPFVVIPPRSTGSTEERSKGTYRSFSARAHTGGPHAFRGAKKKSPKVSAAKAKEQSEGDGEKKKRKTVPLKPKMPPKISSAKEKEEVKENPTPPSEKMPQPPEKPPPVPPKVEETVSYDPVVRKSRAKRQRQQQQQQQTSGQQTIANGEVEQKTNGTDTATSSRSSHSSSSKGKCTNCGQSSEHMKKCAGCGKTRYCSRNCQKQHWKQHKPHCTPSTPEDGSKILNGHRESGKTKKTQGTTAEVKAEEEDELPTSCSTTNTRPSVQPRAPVLKCETCGKESSSLKRCKCYGVSYCDAQCQRKDWPNHKKTCSAPKSKAG